MGAAPRLALLSLALPADAARATTSTRIDRGLAALAARHRVHVVGGNLTRSPGPLMIDVTVDRHREAAAGPDARAARGRATRST